MVYPYVGLDIEKNNSLSTNDTRKHVQCRERQSQSNVRQYDVRSFTAAKNSTGRVKMTATEKAGGGLLQTSRSSRDVEGQVKDPPKKLVENERNSLVHGGILKILEVK